MKAKKGSKAYRAKLSAAQKQAWAERKAKAPSMKEFAQRAQQPTQTMKEEIVDYINSAETLEERQNRKTALYALLYGARPQDVLKDDPRFATNTKWHFQAAAEEPKAFYGTADEAVTSPASEQLTDQPKAGPYSGSIFRCNFNTAESNPKTLTGNFKVPVLSVVPPASIIAQATAMRYGAFLAPKVDGTKGYGPYNWRDQPIEAHIYIDAAMRHLMQWFDGDEVEIIRDDEGRVIDEVSHLAFALATIGILLDAKANATLIDDRPKVRRQAASNLLAAHKLTRFDK